MASDTHGDPEHVSEERAAEVFRRAAALQSAATQRVEERAREASESGTPALRELGAKELEAIGREVGIEPAFIRLALAETPVAPLGRFPRWGARWLLRTPADNLLLASRTVPGSPEAVLAAMRQVLPRDPYRLLLVDTTGDPLHGGALVFQVPAWSLGMPPLAYYGSGISARRLTFQLRRVPSEDGAATPSRTEIEISGDLGPGVRSGVAVATLLGGCLGTVGGIGGFVSAGVLSGGVGFLAIAAAAGGFVLGGLLGGRGYGAIHRHSQRGFRDELDAMLGAIAAHLSTGGGFSVDPADVAPPVEAESWLGS